MDAESMKPKPDWVDEGSMKGQLDARPMLAQGGHPVGPVIQEITNYVAGDIYLLETPFLPTPLINKVCALGFESWSEQLVEGHFRNWFLRQ